MAKPTKTRKVKAKLKLQIHGGKASPAPPVGPVLGQYGVPLMDFCKEFNDRTKDLMGELIPVVMTVYEDRSFTFITKTPVTSQLILKALNLKSGSGVPNKQKVGKLTRVQAEEIAKIKMNDLNTNDIEEAVQVIYGQARSMGVETE